MDLEELEKTLNIKFRNKNLLKNAFIHRSYLNEHSEEKLPNNERLEFLGDSVLAFVVSTYLFQNHPDSQEGDLTNFRASLVNSKSLSVVAKRLNLGKFLYLSRGEEATGGREREYLLANTVESLIGAIYLDSGIEKVSSFIKNYILNNLEEIIEKELYKDFKSKMQERSQEVFSITPTYQVIIEEGPDHNKKFRVGVYLGKLLVSEGEGKSKQEAEQKAAKGAYESDWNILRERLKKILK